MVFCVPRFERLFVDFKFKVPEATIIVLDASAWLVEFWFFFAPLIITLLLLVDGPVYYLMRLRCPRRSWLWAGLMNVLPLGVLLITFVGLLLPYLKVIEGLSK